MGEVRAALVSATHQLTEISQTPRLDAELLMSHALGVSREAVLLSYLDSETPDAFAPLLSRRLLHEPIAYITGRRDFWTISLTVASGVLIPRADSEILVETAIEHFGSRVPNRVLDLGTGSGALLLAALDQWPEAYGLGVDASEMALTYAEINAIDLGLEARARFVQGDWARDIEGQFDLILCNPPYVDRAAELPAQVALYEPHGALFADDQGLADYHILAPQIARLIAPGGCAVVEIGHDQATAVTTLFTAEGLIISLQHDLADRDRCLKVTHPD
jgi:release factor glutamine methyltransferase